MSEETKRKRQKKKEKRKLERGDNYDWKEFDRMSARTRLKNNNLNDCDLKNLLEIERLFPTDCW